MATSSARASVAVSASGYRADSCAPSVWESKGARRRARRSQARTSSTATPRLRARSPQCPPGCIQSPTASARASSGLPLGCRTGGPASRSRHRDGHAIDRQPDERSRRVGHRPGGRPLGVVRDAGPLRHRTPTAPQTAGTFAPVSSTGRIRDPGLDGGACSRRLSVRSAGNGPRRDNRSPDQR